MGTQLTQTILLGYDSPAVLLSSLGSAAVLAAVIQTPAVSHFFGCTPLGPVGWTTAAMAAGAASLGALALPALTRRLPQKLLALPHLDELWRPIRLPEFSTSWTSSTTVKA